MLGVVLFVKNVRFWVLWYVGVCWVWIGMWCAKGENAKCVVVDVYARANAVWVLWGV